MLNPQGLGGVVPSEVGRILSRVDYKTGVREARIVVLGCSTGRTRSWRTGGAVEGAAVVHGASTAAGEPPGGQGGAAHAIEALQEVAMRGTTESAPVSTAMALMDLAWDEIERQESREREQREREPHNGRLAGRVHRARRRA